MYRNRKVKFDWVKLFSISASFYYILFSDIYIYIYIYILANCSTSCSNGIKMVLWAYFQISDPILAWNWKMMLRMKKSCWENNAVMLHLTRKWFRWRCSIILLMSRKSTHVSTISIAWEAWLNLMGSTLLLHMQKQYLKSANKGDMLNFIIIVKPLALTLFLQWC